METTGWNLTPADIRHCHYDGHDVLQNISKDEEQRCSRIAIATSAFAKLPGAPPQVLGGKPQVRPVSAESCTPAPTRITRTRRAGPDTRAEMHPKSSGLLVCDCVLLSHVCLCTCGQGAHLRADVALRRGRRDVLAVRKELLSHNCHGARRRARHCRKHQQDHSRRRVHACTCSKQLESA